MVSTLERKVGAVKLKPRINRLALEGTPTTQMVGVNNIKHRWEAILYMRNLHVTPSNGGFKTHSAILLNCGEVHKSLYSVWKEKRKRLKAQRRNRDNRAMQKLLKTRHSLSNVLRSIILQKLPEEPSSVQQTWLHYQDSQAGAPKTHELATINRLLENYFKLKEAGISVTWKELALYSKLKYASTAYDIIVRKRGLEPITRQILSSSRIAISPEEMELAKKLDCTPFRVKEISYLLGWKRPIPTLSYMFRHLESRPWANGSKESNPKSIRVVDNYTTAVKIYESIDLGFTIDETAALNDLKAGTVRKYLRARPPAEAQISEAREIRDRFLRGKNLETMLNP